MACAGAALADGEELGGRRTERCRRPRRRARTRARPRRPPRPCRRTPCPGRVLRTHDARDEAADDDVGAAQASVGTGHRGGVHPNKQLIVGWHGPIDLHHALDLGRPYRVVHDRPHAITHGAERTTSLRPLRPASAWSLRACLQLAPAACAVVIDDLPEDRQQRRSVDRLTLEDHDLAPGLGLLAARDDPSDRRSADRRGRRSRGPSWPAAPRCCPAARSRAARCA